jgi:hypothetical protein
LECGAFPPLFVFATKKQAKQRKNKAKQRKNKAK